MVLTQEKHSEGNALLEYGIGGVMQGILLEELSSCILRAVHYYIMDSKGGGI